MEKDACALSIVNLFFTEYSFTRDILSNDEEYGASYNIEYSIANDDARKVKVTIVANVSSKDQKVHLNLKMVGLFKIEKSDVDKTTYDDLVRISTVAIMFPYLRSQVSLLTTQPGMNPVMLPPVDLNELAK